MLAVLAATVVAGPAKAATVDVVGSPGPPWTMDGAPTGLVVRFLAAPGERNRASIEAVASGAMVRDAGTALIAGRGCVAVDPHSVSCGALPPPQDHEPMAGAAVDLGDQDDSLRVTPSAEWWGLSLGGGPGDDTIDVVGPPMNGVYRGGGEWVDGGAGADRISGGPSTICSCLGPEGQWLRGGSGPDRIRGGPGNDELDGGPGRDTLQGGKGDDELSGGDRAGSPDVVDGGPGRDTVDYAFHTIAPASMRVHVDLLHPSRSVPRDRLRSIENISQDNGNAPPSVLAGDNGANEITGLGWLVGRGGNDHLSASSYWASPPPRIVVSRLDGGAGNDVLEPNRPEDHVRCGPGQDVLTSTFARPPGQFVPRDCETLRTQFNRWGQPALRRGRLVIRVRPVQGGVARCSYRLVVRDRRGRLVASVGYRGGAHRLSLPLVRAVGAHPILRFSNYNGAGCLGPDGRPGLADPPWFYRL